MKRELLNVARAIWLTCLGALAVAVTTPRAEADPHWSTPTYTYGGSTTFTMILPGGQSFPQTFDWPEDRGYGPLSFGPGYGVDVLSAGSITATMTWVDDDGNP